jgi:cytochrome c oxidase subunit 2
MTALVLSTAIPVSALPGTSIFAPAATPAHSIARLGTVVLAITGGIFLALWLLTAYVVVRYRARPPEENLEPPQVFGSTEIELAWTIIPILLIIVLFLTTAGVLFALQHLGKPANALEVVVIGHQFWWEFRYPQLHITSANELHLPVSNAPQYGPAYMKLTSADVDHSFWVPRLAGKVDLIPNRVNELWIDPRTPGLYLGQCNQFCGTQHAKMLLRVYVDTAEQFSDWVRNQQQPAAQNSAADGRQAFESESCVNCHTIAGTSANGRFGPDLTHLMSRQTIASGAVQNTRDNLMKWVDDPDTFKPGCLMPSLHLSSPEISQITDYLMSLK